MSMPVDEPLDGTVEQVMQMLLLSKRQIYRLCETGDLESYKLGELRRITWASVRRYRERCLAAGPQLKQKPLVITGKRRVGRPRKASTEAAS
jgi:excisionase family DNA binding protein